MQSNGFTGTVPNFVGNPSIYYVNLQYNQLSGTIPAFKNLNNLRYLYFKIIILHQLENQDLYQVYILIKHLIIKLQDKFQILVDVLI